MVVDRLGFLKPLLHSVSSNMQKDIKVVNSPKAKNICSAWKHKTTAAKLNHMFRTTRCLFLYFSVNRRLWK